MNFKSCCHKHKVQAFHFRNKEKPTMIAFYKKHYTCMVEDPANLETKEDQKQQTDWMDEYPEDEILLIDN